MKGYKKVKVLSYEGYGAEVKCEKAINKGIRSGWQPIDICSFVPPDNRYLKVIAFMGKLDKESGFEGKQKETKSDKTTSKDAERKETEDFVRCPQCGKKGLMSKDRTCKYCGYQEDEINTNEKLVF